MSDLLNQLLLIEQLSYDDCLYAINNFENAVEALHHFNLTFNDTTRKHLINHVKKYGFKFLSRKGWKYQVSDVKDAVIGSNNFSEVCRKLDISICTFNIKRIQTICVNNNISTSHFDAKHSKNHKVSMVNKRTRTIENSLIEHSTLNRSSLRPFLIKNNLFKNECSCCGISEWQGKPITIEVDHINGISDDNRLENLRWLCPNCHSQTETFKTGNIDKLKPRTNFKRDNIQSTPIMHECKCCGKPFIKHTKTTKYCSVECSNKSKHSNNWDEIDLIDMVDNKKISFRQISIRMGVSLNAVRRQYLKRKEKQL